MFKENISSKIESKKTFKLPDIKKIWQKIRTKGVKYINGTMAASILVCTPLIACNTPEQEQPTIPSEMPEENNGLHIEILENGFENEEELTDLLREYEIDFAPEEYVNQLIESTNLNADKKEKFTNSFAYIRDSFSENWIDPGLKNKHQDQVLIALANNSAFEKIKNDIAEKEKRQFTADQSALTVFINNRNENVVYNIYNTDQITNPTTVIAAEYVRAKFNVKNEVTPYLSSFIYGALEIASYSDKAPKEKVADVQKLTETLIYPWLNDNSKNKELMKIIYAEINRQQKENDANEFINLQDLFIRSFNLTSRDLDFPNAQEESFQWAYFLKTTEALNEFIFRYATMSDKFINPLANNEISGEYNAAPIKLSDEAQNNILIGLIVDQAMAQASADGKSHLISMMLPIQTAKIALYWEIED